MISSQKPGPLEGFDDSVLREILKGHSLEIPWILLAGLNARSLDGRLISVQIRVGSPANALLSWVEPVLDSGQVFASTSIFRPEYLSAYVVSHCSPSVENLEVEWAQGPTIRVPTVPGPSGEGRWSVLTVSGPRKLKAIRALDALGRALFERPLQDPRERLSLTGN